MRSLSVEVMRSTVIYGYKDNYLEEKMMKFTFRKITAVNSSIEPMT